MRHIDNVDYLIVLVIIMIGLVVVLIGQNVHNATGGAFFSGCNPALMKNYVETRSISPTGTTIVSYNKCSSKCITVKELDSKENVISEKTACGV